MCQEDPVAEPKESLVFVPWRRAKISQDDALNSVNKAKFMYTLVGVHWNYSTTP